MSTFQHPVRQGLPQVLSDFVVRIRRLEAVPQYPPYRVKVFADRNALDGNLPDSAIVVSVGDGKFIHAIESGLDGAWLNWCYAYVSGMGSGDLEVMLRNITQGVDMLASPLVIPAGDVTSQGSTPDIDLANSQVAEDDLIAIDVDADGGGDAEGLGVGFNFKL